MITYIIKRLIQAVFILLLLTFIVYGVMRFVPGDPLLMYLGATDIQALSPEALDQARQELGLDQGILVQYFKWLGNVFQGDWGKSFHFKADVLLLISQRMPVTIYLGVLAFFFSSTIGISLGIIAAVRRGKWADTVATLAANTAITIPIFWLGIIMILIFGVSLGWLPIAGFTSPFDDFWLSTKKLIMPVICLMIGSMGSNARLTRTSMLEVIRQDYIRTAWSKGLKERVIILKHALKNSLIPVITVMGLQVRFIFGGAVLIEQVFAIPGMGRLLVDATFGKDYMVVQGCVLVIGIIVVLTNLIVDISYGWLDPRVRYD
ncbi:MAG: peptide ABC transporter [Chloroflexi bacterium RBG_13_51_52]|nr:MAG: peptide ABC transporter [Chloroflexi bacterium RBG_13_51_52]